MFVFPSERNQQYDVMIAFYLPSEQCR